MHIAFIAQEIAPFAAPSEESSNLSALGGGFFELGHTVRAIVPFPAPGTSTASLARRLMPLELEAHGGTLECIRYDGRTPSGVEVHAIEIADDNEHRPADDPWWVPVLARAAAAIFDGLDSRPDWCISVGPWSHAMPKRLEWAYDRDHDIKQLVQVTGPMSAKAAEALVNADRIVFNEHGDREAARPSLEHDPKREGWSVATIPAGTDYRGREVDKRSAKAAFQLEAGLPVRPDVPLLVVSEAATPAPDESLRYLLGQDTQVILVSDDAEREKLVDRFPDRLTLVPAGAAHSEIFEPADGIATNDPGLVRHALAAGVVPVLPRPGIRPLIDLSPDLSSGSAFIACEDDPGLVEPLGRFLGAYTLGPTFEDLRERLPRYADSWQTVAGKYLEIMQ